MYVNTPTINLAHILPRNFLCSVPTFKNGFENLTCKCKAIIHMDNNLVDMSSICLEIYKYKLESKIALLFYDVNIGSTPLAPLNQKPVLETSL